MAEPEQSPPQSDAAVEEFSNLSFSLWPPSERSRGDVRAYLIEALSTPSVLSQRYEAISREESGEAAKTFEEEAFEVAGKEATADDDGFEILQVYSKEISKRIMDKLKARSDNAATKADEVDAGSTAPPQSENTESVAGEYE